MATAYPVYSPASAPGLAQFLDADTMKVGYLQATQMTLGSVIFASTGGLLAQDNANFFWDATNKRLGIGAAAAPTSILHVVQPVRTSGSENVMILTGGAHTTLATGVEALDVNFNFNRTVQFATGAIALQRSIRYGNPTYAFVGASTITDAVTVGINGAPIAGTNATFTNAHALLISAGAVGAGTQKSYGLTVNAQTGGTANYAAQFMGGNVGIGTATPTNLLQVDKTQAGAETGIWVYNASTSGGGTYATVGVGKSASGPYGYLLYSGEGNSSSDLLSGSRVAVVSSGSGGLALAAGHASGYIPIYTGGTLAANERMRIAADGKVGIGTTSADVALYVSYSHTGAGVFSFKNTHASGFSGWTAWDSAGTYKTSMGWGNASAGGAYQSKAYIDLNTGVDLYIGHGAGELVVKSDGKIGIGVTGPTAVLHLKAGTTAANTAPLKLNSGDLVTAPEAGAIEFLTDTFYGTITTGPTRKAFAFAADVVPTSRTITAGTGLSGGGDLTANRTLSLDQAVIPTWTGAHTFTGGVTFKNHSAFADSGFIPETRAVQTTTVTPAVLWSKTLADDTLYWVEVRVIGRDTAGVERAYYGRTFYVYRQSAGVATLGNVIELFSEETDAAWDVGVNVNTNDVEVKVTGKSSVTINWAGTVMMQAVSGNA